MIRALRALTAIAIAAAGFFVLYETIEQPSSQLFGRTIVHGAGHVVALTFDDGPNERTTPGVLAELERTGVRATFFVVGRAVPGHAALLRRMVRDGDEIGNHTATHPHLNAFLRAADIGHEIDVTQAAVEAATGQRPRYLRPPFGARDYAALDMARRRGLKVVMWTAMLDDEPAGARPAQIARALLARVHDGAIVVMHDGDAGRAGTGGRTYESAALGLVIANLKEHGFRFVTISELETSAHA